MARVDARHSRRWRRSDVVRYSRAMRRNALAAAILAAAIAGPAAAATAFLFWTPPTENTDGSPLTDLAGYRVNWGCVSSGNYPSSVTVLQPALRSFEVQDLPSTGTCYFAVEAVNSGRVPRGIVPSSTSVESDPSNEAVLNMGAPPTVPRVPYTRATIGAPVTAPTPPLETLLAGRIVRGYVGEPVEFVVDNAPITPAPTRHELRARFIQSGEIIVVPFAQAPAPQVTRVQWSAPFAGLWYFSLRSCNGPAETNCGEWRSSAEDGQVWWFQLKAPTGGGIDP